jgi:hypothetical protein
MVKDIKGWHVGLESGRMRGFSETITYQPGWLFSHPPGQPFEQGFPVAFPFQPKQGKPNRAGLQVQGEEKVGKFLVHFVQASHPLGIFQHFPQEAKSCLQGWRSYNNAVSLYVDLTVLSVKGEDQVRVNF